LLEIKVAAFLPSCRIKTRGRTDREFAVQRLVVAVVLGFTMLSSALADIRIVGSPGGAVADYLNFFSKVRRSGERVIIDGPCLSACTLVLSNYPARSAPSPAPQAFAEQVWKPRSVPPVAGLSLCFAAISTAVRHNIDSQS
jgi:hypothetical protein